MTRRRRLATSPRIAHAETGQQLEVRHMEGGGFNIGLPDDADPVGRWAVRSLFTAKGGTTLVLVPVDADEPDDDGSSS